MLRLIKMKCKHFKYKTIWFDLLFLQESISDPHVFSESSLEPDLAPRDGVTELTLTFITDYYKFKVKDLEIKICEDSKWPFFLTIEKQIN